MKKLIKFKIFGTFIIFLLCFIFHFAYDFWPNIFFKIIFPVNESIWEHMKLIFSSYIFYGIIEYFLIRKKINFNNYILNLFLGPTIGIILYLILFIPLFLKYGENIIISLSLLFIIIIIEEIISYYLLIEKKFKYEKIIGLIGIFMMYGIFAYLTYYPLSNFLFYY